MVKAEAVDSPASCRVVLNDTPSLYLHRWTCISESFFLCVFCLLYPAFHVKMAVKEILFHLRYHISHMHLLQTQECLVLGTGLSLINNLVWEKWRGEIQKCFLNGVCLIAVRRQVSEPTAISSVTSAHVAPYYICISKSSTFGQQHDPATVASLSAPARFLWIGSPNCRTSGTHSKLTGFPTTKSLSLKKKKNATASPPQFFAPAWRSRCDGLDKERCSQVQK